MMTKRLGWIDIAKGICIFAVIIGHKGFEHAGFVFSFHLTVFFILAGYTSKIQPLTGELIKKWFRQLMKPFFFTCVAVLGMELVNFAVLGRQASIIAVTDLIATYLKRFFFAAGSTSNFGSIDMGKFIGAIWFLPAMFFARIALQLILNHIKDRKFQILSSVAIAAVAVAVSNVIWLPFSILSGIFAVPFMLFGFLLKEYQILEKLKPWHYLLLAVFFVIGTLTGYSQRFYFVTCTMEDAFLTPAFGFASSLVVIGISRFLDRFPMGVLKYFGRNSLIVLCVHLFEMNTLYKFYAYGRKLLHLEETPLVKLIMSMIVIIIFTVILVWVKKFLESKGEITVKASGRDESLVIMLGFLIVLMIIGHTKIDYDLHKYIYSFHMIAFVIVSGYFYKSGQPLKTQLLKCFKSLKYYGIFCIIYLFVSNRELLDSIKILLGGISYTKDYFTSFQSVGPIYFILLLFVVRLLYVLIDHFFKGYKKDIVILIVSVAGILLGQKGIWLFWSFDCAMFCLIFFHMAQYFRKYDLLSKINNMPYLYFVLASLWALFNFKGSMDLATRRYDNIGILIIGSVSAFLLIFMLCSYLWRHWPGFVTKLIAFVGESTAYILIIHTLFEAKITAFVANTLLLNQENIYNLILKTFIQVALGTLIYFSVDYIKKLIGKLIKKTKALPTVATA